MMDPTVAETAGKANTLGVRGSDVSYGSPSFVADFKKFTAGTNISYGKSGPIAFDTYGDLKYDPTTSYDTAEFNKDGQIVNVDL
ncbi:hypothetical protein MNEG_8097 [Monoraphidium neglectum]|uniref:Uncharacterized protein n=1 Tax=Monoraphidium neglectum TaxID=145388 RepID=A0A0D2N0L6_9CHLO|nr:hypothetical protein MNEG_8097 [Monoraphidium neglectum]KIY99865.1 hypothetical protein MNEG_8097 [Monoraphidium neglectum]|eukprot:XP_013898885.1 hypothetical protein MNEG_8097 [Monoraphidium neglectum]